MDRESDQGSLANSLSWADYECELIRQSKQVDNGPLAIQSELDFEAYQHFKREALREYRCRTLEEVVQVGFMAYPSLFKHRFHVLSHLFLTNGNGYEWTADGRLIEDDEPSGGMICYLETIRDPHYIPCQGWLKVINPIEYRVYPFGGREFTPAYCMPENVQPDFLDGAIEVTRMALAHSGFDLQGKDVKKELNELLEFLEAKVA